jgi:hypothetical protein
MLGIPWVTRCAARFTNGYPPDLSAGCGSNLLWWQSVIHNVVAVAAEAGRNDGVLEQLFTLLRSQPIMLKIPLTEMVPGNKTVVGGLQPEVMVMADRMAVVC